MIARGAAALELLERRVEREELRVHVQFAHPSRDELGELAPEVEDHDGLGGGRIGARRPVVRGAVRSGGLQRRLEVGLDLGVVRSEDTVA